MRLLLRESAIEAYLVRKVDEAGGMTRKASWIGRRGAPDRVVFLPGGVVVWVELKAPGKKPDPHQAREHFRLAQMEQRVLVIDSKEQVDEFLNKEAKQ
jgi:hypothetical protein